mmetsp:Transcript_44384/g.111837  ORF Transcript_44384/g.111837 Transcript_44384/m.111837 type:complete len:208 (-) Transcript_44384:146-769(-)|eukprot:CAMPEP_0177670022 /NCGR_PEP_ID=MMETSP0447-20121125/23836_1 /TAXON_ID=0 /ORGANISM="Stygamoeba regulata, Strain BSH-02190019" /LENGTH=207 /DNA_ID=CAMNT_0019177095 /DNA_START=36 /DNA_END=659 /DNA_ORIENTATION=+
MMHEQPEEESAFAQPPVTRLEPSPQATHPITLFFHCFFKALALLVYLFAQLLLGIQDVPLFITVATLLAMDFWTVKNITGRLLVGLRWWNRVKEDGSTEWIFESREKEFEANRLEMFVFWLAMAGATLLWGLILLWKILSFLTLLTDPLSPILCVLGFTLSAVNLMAYFWCAREARKTAHQYVMKEATGFMVNQMMQKATAMGEENL